MTFQVGDIVKQVEDLREYENPIAIIIDITAEGKIIHRHVNSRKVRQASSSSFVLVEPTNHDNVTWEYNRK